MSLKAGLVHVELMMLENGYKKTQMKCGWCINEFKEPCNAILDYNVHVKNMTQDETEITY
jgi:hypothetical protein